MNPPCRFKCRATRRFNLTVRNARGGEAASVPLEEAVLFSLEDGQDVGVETFGANEEIRITTPRPGSFAVGEEYTIDIRKRVLPCTTPTAPRSKKATASSSPA